MAYYEMMPAGLPAGLQSGMDSVLNKKFGTATTYAPEDWPDTVNLMGPLPEKTIVSSPIADFNDGADDVPTKSLIVTIPATLSGVSTITETQTGRNLLDVPAREEMTRNGIISSISADGTITASGQSTGNGDIIVTLGTSVNLLGGETYTFSIIGTDTRSGSVYVYFTGGSYISINNANHSGTYTPSADQTITGITLRMFNTQTITLSAKIMLEIGSTAHAYEPYTAPTTYTAQLGRTVYGGTADLVTGEGVDGYGNIDMGTLTWQYDSVNTRFFTVGLTGVIKRGTSGWITDLAVDSTYTVASGTANDKTISEYASTGYVYIKDTDYTDPAAFKTFLSGKYLTYPLATPTDFTFTGQEVPTRLGYNAFWSDSGDTEVTYRADINLALQALSGLRGLIMARPQLEPETEPEETKEETPEEMER